MNRGKILDILYHPAFISLIIWLVLVLFIPFSVSRYKIKPISEEVYSRDTYFIYWDLDSDGYSEKISLDLCDPGQTKIIVYKDDKVMDQYDVAYHPSNIQSVFFGDYNSDTYNEIYIFTLNDTALYLSVLDPIAQRRSIVHNSYVDSWKIPPQSTDKPQFVPVGMTVNTDMQSKDLIFYVSTGYSLQPRNLYRYIIACDSLIKSPESYATISQCILIEKSVPTSENTFLLSTQATGNIDETQPYSDLHAWLMALNDEMKFSFKPVMLGQKPSNLLAIPINIRGNTKFLTLYDYFGADDIKSMFCIFDEKGNMIMEKEVEDYEPSYANIFTNGADEGKSFFFLKNHDAVVEQLDTAFNTVKSCSLPALSYTKPIAFLDADLNGHNEYFFRGRSSNSLVICSEEFRDAIEYKLNEEGTDFIITQLLAPGKKPVVHVQLQRHGWLLMYKKNPFYYLQAPVYLALYFMIFLFISFIYRIQKHRLDMKTATEREIASLQMKAIKNQIDPHFTLNVLNSIGSLYLTEEDRRKADYIFGKYAALIRKTVISSDKIIITLEEEIDFVKNYLEIERFRFDNSFKYSIDINSDVDMELKIPRTLMHTFVENSVKYGLRKRAEGGILKIKIRQDKGIVSIVIEDNGPGLIQDGRSPAGTGKGLLIINELADLYYRLEKIRIASSLENITGPKGEILGTSAIIELPLRNS